MDPVLDVPSVHLIASIILGIFMVLDPETLQSLHCLRCLKERGKLKKFLTPSVSH